MSSVTITKHLLIRTFMPEVVQSILVSTIYVATLYSTRTSRGDRNDPKVIKTRLAIALLSSAALLLVVPHFDPGLERFYGLHFDLASTAKSLALTATFFFGPMILRPPKFSGLSLEGMRNCVIGPLTEELVYRSVICGIYQYYGVSADDIVLVTPLYFGVAHIHHALQLLREGERIFDIIFVSLAQFLMTYLFGAYCAFLFTEVGSVWPGVFAHAFCNWVGPPPLTGDGPVWYKPLLLAGMGVWVYGVFHMDLIRG